MEDFDVAVYPWRIQCNVEALELLISQLKVDVAGDEISPISQCKLIGTSYSAAVQSIK